MRFFILLILILGFSSVSNAADPYTESFLRAFHKNPEKMLYQLPPEVRNGVVIPRGFINAEPLSQELNEAKSEIRNEIQRKSIFSITPLSKIGDDDNPAVLADNGIIIKNVLELDRRGLRKAQLPYELWSDSYWPISKGLIAARYADGAGETHNWAANYAYYQSRPTDSVPTDVLSPAEKYDLLVGDRAMTMTNFSWNNGQSYYEKLGRVPSWMGICHGWSAATSMRAPISWGPIVLKGADGQDIRFYQSDMKALVSMLWAKADLPTRFAGFRCDIRPPRDGQGRVTKENCNDTNPGTLYLTLTNQLGIHQRSFVMDSIFDAEVWNFAVISYKGTYFNPQTFQQTDNIRQALVPVKKFTIDKFKQHRAPGTAYVLGVTMDITHMNEAASNHRVQLTPSTKTIRFMYDLELDENYSVIGGEWYSKAHPDFLWTYAKFAQALAPGDVDIQSEDWDVTMPVPAGWAEAAAKSSKEGVPLYSVIKRIVEAAPKHPSSQGSSSDNSEAEN